MKKNDILVLLCYIAALLIYGIHTAVRCGIMIFTGSVEDLRQDWAAHTLHLPDYVTVRSSPELNEVYFTNLLRGAAVLLIVFILMRLIPWLIFSIADSIREQAAEQPQAARRRVRPVQTDGAQGEEGVSVHFFESIRNLFRPEEETANDDIPAETVQNVEAFFAARDAARRAAPDGGNRRNGTGADEFAELSAERDNLRVIVRITQRDVKGRVIVSFFCGDTLGLVRHSVRDSLANKAVGSGEIKQFIRDTRQEPDGVFYEYDIRKAAESPVMLYGSAEDAVRVLDRKITLRVYRQQMLFVTPSLDIRTVDSPAQAPAAVWAVQGSNNRASRTRSYTGTFYQADEGLEFEVEVRYRSVKS